MGICNGLNVNNPIGGQYIPNSIFEDKLLWKNLQKKEIKKKISEIINKIIPHLSPLITFSVWSPWKVLSRVISRHHWNIVNKIIENPIIKRLILYWCNHLIIPETNIKVLRAPIKGQGLKFTKWNEWIEWFDILKYFSIIKSS